MSNPSSQPQSPATPPVPYGQAPDPAARPAPYGQSTVPAAPSPAAPPAMPPAPYGQPPAPTPYQSHLPVTAPADSVGSWMVATFVSLIPLVGFIYLIVVAFGGTASLARRNWARAIFAWHLVGIALLLLLSLAGGTSLFYSFGS